MYTETEDDRCDTYGEKIRGSIHENMTNTHGTIFDATEAKHTFFLHKELRCVRKATWTKTRATVSVFIHLLKIKYSLYTQPSDETS